MSAVDLTVIVATILAVASLVPQALRLHRTRDTAGVSVLWTALGTITNAAWAVYLTHKGLWAGLTATIATVLFYGGLFIALVRLRAPWRPAALGGIGWALFLCAVLALGGWVALGAVLGVSYGVQVAPSVWTAYRTWAPTGISPGTWSLLLVQVLLWGVYGLAERDGAIVLFAVTGTIASILMLARWAVTRGRAPEPVFSPVT
jgi:uncharacterized protein with PQ loop repeat